MSIKNNPIITLVAMVIASAMSFNVSGQLKNWPAGSDPKEVGTTKRTVLSCSRCSILLGQGQWLDGCWND